MNDRPIQVRFPSRAAQMLADAATRQGTTTSGIVRRFTYDGLRGLGFDPTGIPADGGAGVQQWALVIGDEVKSLHQANDKPADEQGGQWLPVVYQDSAPFDPDLHHRLAPWMRVEASRVVRTYPVVEKAEAV